MRSMRGQEFSCKEGPAGPTAHSRNAKKVMVRVLFNGAVLPLVGCAGQEDAKKGGLCSLAAFRDMARRRDPEDYRKACEPRARL